MSFKSRDLSYEAHEPPFLRKLKGQLGDHSDLHQRSVVRPRKVNITDEDDDEPTYVTDDNHEIISKAQYEKMLRDVNRKSVETLSPSRPTAHEDAHPVQHPNMDTVPKKNIQAAIGGASKRRIAKVIGSDAEGRDARDTLESVKPVKKPTKQAKKVKLSFDD